MNIQALGQTSPSAVKAALRRLSETDPTAAREAVKGLKATCADLGWGGTGASCETKARQRSRPPASGAALERERWDVERLGVTVALAGLEEGFARMDADE